MIGKKFLKVSGNKTVGLHEKAIRDVNFTRGSEIKRTETYYEYIFLEPEKEPFHDKVVLSGGQRRPKKKKMLMLEIRLLQTKMRKRDKNLCIAMS